MRLHGYFRSSAAFRVRIALNLKGLDYGLVAHHLRKGEQRNAAYLAINPQGLVPSLETDDGRTLTQSLAIIEYLEEAHPLPSLLPVGAADRARVRAIAHICAMDIHPLNNLRVLRYLRGEMGQEQDAIDVWYRHWVIEGFSAIEQMLAADARTGLFCHGDLPGMADACLVPQALNGLNLQVPLETFPTIQRIYERALDHPAFANAHPRAQPDSE